MFVRVLPEDFDDSESAEKFHTIGEVALLVGIDAKTIRFYEKSGLLRPARASGLRVFQSEDVLRLRVIRILRSLGGALSDIKKVMNCLKCGGESALKSPCFIKLIEERIAKQLAEIEIMQHNIRAAETIVSGAHALSAITSSRLACALVGTP
jgi:MerR family copper efflux transcriptional regulator